MNKLVLMLSALSLLVACDLSGTPGSSTNASISGRFTYVGPPPNCDRGQLEGKFVFLLYQNPIRNPLNGVATPFATRTEDAEFVFDASTDCQLNPLIEIERPTSYTLDRFGPSRALLEETDFRLIAIFDRDGNFVPGDPLRGQPNRDDMFGAAYTTLASRRFQRLTFGPTLSPQLVDVDVTVDAQVWSDTPAFWVKPGTKPLSSEAVVSSDNVMEDWEEQVYGLTEMQIQVLPAASEPWRTILDEEEITLTDGPPARAFWAREVDPARTLNSLPHPIYGPRPPAFQPAGLSWRTPFLVMKRLRSTAEERTGVPDVYLVPLSRPTEQDKRVFSTDMDMLVPAVALVDLDPERPVCQVPYIAPGHTAETYERSGGEATSGVPVECQELPTGEYDMTLQQGVAGGVATSGAPSSISDTGFRVDDDEYIGQSWTIPNELPLNDQRATFLVIDPDPGSGPDDEATDLGHGAMGCAMAPGENNGGELREVTLQQVPLFCCEKVQHLCGIPLCEASAGVRQATSSSRGRPNCMPFLIPQSCCPDT